MAQDKMLKFLVEGLTRAFDKQEDCDVMFSVDGQTIGAHRLILNIHSQVLYEMAAGWTPDKDPIAIDDMSFDSFKALLRYMYCCELPLSNDSVFIFLSASTHFKINLLEDLCVDHITNSMNTENVCVYMNEAVNFKSTALQEKCCEIFSEQIDEISDESFVGLSRPALSSFLDIECINTLEIMLFLVIKLWMEEQCRDQGLAINGTNMRLVIGDALYKIRFPTMTVQDFANSVTTIKGLLTKDEIADVFQKIAVFDSQDIECAFPYKFRCKNSHYHVPYSDMEKLLKEKIVYNNVANQYSDCSSALKFAKDEPDDKEICTSLLSLRYILQCCADLANTSPVTYYTSVENQAARNEVYDDFLAWQDVAKTKSVSDTMPKYLELRTKLDKLYRWSL